MYLFICVSACKPCTHGEIRGELVGILSFNYIGPGGQLRLSSLVAETFGLTCLMILPAHGLCIYCLTCILSITLDALWYVSNNYSETVCIFLPFALIDSIILCVFSVHLPSKYLTRACLDQSALDQIRLYLTRACLEQL